MATLIFSYMLRANHYTVCKWTKHQSLVTKYLVNCSDHSSNEPWLKHLKATHLDLGQMHILYFNTTLEIWAV